MANVTATKAAPKDERLRKVSLLSKALHRPELGAVAGVILVFIFFGIVAAGSGMFSTRGIISFLEVSAQLGILAVAVSLLMIGGEFDLSIGSMIGAAGMVIAISAAVYGLPLWLCLLLAFAVALLVGYVNGYLVIKTGLPSFIVTLGALFILRGLTIGFTRLLTGRTQVGGLRDIAEQSWIAPLFAGEIFGIPMGIVWWVGITALATWVLLRTRFGNWIFACGGDPVAARNVGVPVARVKIILFMCTAAAATLLGAIQVLDAGSADVQRGLLKEFEAIIAVVIGGTLLTGGYGSAIGAALGALIFGTVQMGIFYTGADTDWFKVFLGAMMLIAVIFNNYIRKQATGGK